MTESKQGGISSAGGGGGGGLQKAFYCDLCSKGYSRIHEYDAHLSSYDHSHKKRLADMKAMQRDPSLTEKRRERERKQELMGSLGGMVKIKPINIKMDNASSSAGPGNNHISNHNNKGDSSGGGFKKGGFKSAFGDVEEEKNGEKKEREKVVIGGGGVLGFKKTFAGSSSATTGKLNDTGYAMAPVAVTSTLEGSLKKPGEESSGGRGGLGAGRMEVAEVYESDTEDEGYTRYNPEFPTS